MATDDGYCCLGVLCKIEGVSDQVMGKAAMISDTMAKRAGLHVGESNMLAHMNDEGFSFDVIAANLREIL